MKPSPEERHGIENKLLNRLREAEHAFRAASEHHRAIRARHPILDAPEDLDECLKAATREEEALKEYMRAFRAFADLILYGKYPPSRPSAPPSQE